ncbi:MAG: urea ABC transporter ATP-binding subunit UrtE [Betaproteobacteria bacterium]|jgi:urea transport system ATP-binding protein|nr:urea ABC transporter ATP-binding subunit UrtE [Betaproteobacteria bacterium]
MLRIEGLNQFYGGSHVLRDISLEVPMGEVTALLGRNGVGKTTLLKCLTGLLPIRSGRILLDGQDISNLAPHRRARLGLGYVPQGREIFPRLSVEENLRIAMAASGNDGAIPDWVFETFPIVKTFLKRRGGDLSGGQQQQLAIARALVTKPRLLILDEPTEGIQPNVIQMIEQVIAGLAERKEMAILLVEQYYDFAKSLADHYAVLQRGEVIASGLGANMESDGVRELVAV